MKRQILSILLLAAITSPAQAEQLRINGPSHYGCTNRDDYKKTIDMVVQNDSVAFNKFLGAGIALGVCTMFKDGEPVHMVKSGLLTVQVRRAGDVEEYWTSRESVK